MASTYLSLHYHLVFSTKRRIPAIPVPWLARFHDYLGGTVRGLDGIAEGVGGTPDHVHILTGLKATHCLAGFVRELKKTSSAWMRDTAGEHAFAWQEGYAAFTVSPGAREKVRTYIANQEEHHRKKSFRDELLELLNRAGVDFDERFFD